MSRAILLLVDDSETNRAVFRRMVERHMPRCRLVTARDAHEGLILAAKMRPDCAVVDVNMPGMNGIELCRRLKAEEATAHFPILLLTTQDADSALRVTGLEAGADDFLQRHDEDINLVAKMRVMLRIKRAEDQLRSVNKKLAEVAEERSRELHESDERYRLLFTTCSDGVAAFEVRPDMSPGAVIEVNDALCRRLGYTHEELLRLTLLDFFPPNRAGGVLVRIESILKHKQVFFETVLLSRDEHAIPVAIHARFFESVGSGTVVTVIQDLAGPEEGRDQHGESPTRYRLLASQTGQMIYDCLVASGRIKWGGAMTQVTGYTPEEITTFSWERWRKWIHRDDRAHVLGVLRQALAAVGKYQLEYRLRHRSGKYRHIEDVGVVLPGEDGKAYRVLGTIKDITARVLAEEERRKLEREMQHSQRLESLGVLAGGIAHDFNNILAAIIGLTDMALQDIPKDSETYGDLREALNAGHRAKELVKQILTFSRQSGEERAPLFLHVVVREALKLVRASLPAMIEIIDNVDVHSGAVLANAAQMHQVIMNYCTNAAQALTDRGGLVEVTVVDVDVREGLARTHPKLRAGPYVRLSVRDTGYGMDTPVLNRIFDPFFTTKGPGEGTGMGLAVVHGIVTAHGGAIIVESKRGQGTSFHTYFPRVPTGMMEEEPEQEPVQGGHERILLVDDEDIVLHFAEISLVRLGYDVVACRNGHEALEAFWKAPDSFDLVVTDQMMPRMTGEELAESVRKLRDDVPIVLFTGFSEPIAKEKARAAGIHEVLLKPVIALDLAKTVRRVLDEFPGKGAQRE